MSISPTGSTRCAATARVAPTRRGAWHGDGRRLQATAPRSDGPSASAEEAIESPARCSRSPIPIASPRIAARRQLPARQWPRRQCRSGRRRWRASRSSPSPRSPAAPRRAASCWRRRSRSPRSRRSFADRIEARDEISVRRREREPARAPAAPARRHRARRTADQARADRRHRPHARAKASRGSASTGCRGPRRCGSGATGCCSCAAPKATSGRTCRTRRSPATATDWLAPTLAGKTALGELGADELGATRCTACCHGACAAGSTPRRRPISPRRRAPRCRSTTQAEEGPKLAIRVQELFGLDRHPADRRRTGAAGDRAAVAGAPAGAGDARSARLLARQLCGGQSRDERPLSAPSLARRPAVGAADAPRQAARPIERGRQWQDSAPADSSHFSRLLHSIVTNHPESIAAARWP